MAIIYSDVSLQKIQYGKKKISFCNTDFFIPGPSTSARDLGLFFFNYQYY